MAVLAVRCEIFSSTNSEIISDSRMPKEWGPANKLKSRLTNFRLLFFLINNRELTGKIKLLRIFRPGTWFVYFANVSCFDVPTLGTTRDE
jgi:hypothetical protein